MLDINLLRPAKGGDPELVRESQRRRYADPSVVDRVMELDEQWREAKYRQEGLSRDFNQLNKDIAARRKAKEDTAALQDKSKSIKAALAQGQEDVARLERSRDELLATIGNIVDDSVPVSNDEADNQVYHVSTTTRRGLTAQERASLISHSGLVRRLGIVDTEAGAAAAGDRGYFLLSDGVMLNQALISYGLHFLRSRGWCPVQPPYWLTGEAMTRCAQLSQFDEELYRVLGNEDKQTGPGRPTDLPHTTPSTSGRSGNTSSTMQHSTAEQATSAQAPSSSGPVTDTATESGSSRTKYLIATSEQALCALHQDVWLEAADLPLRYAGLSTCFRREVGSHGKDTLGIFRVHQFDKVEQFAVTAPGPHDSAVMMQDMIRNAQDFYDALHIPYRLVRIVSGALNASAACKVDLEGWFPASGAYRELVSVSNCTDYQARKLIVRMRTAPSRGSGNPAQAPGPRTPSTASANSVHVHMLNGTLCASQRTLCSVLENHQTSEGVRVPAVLQPYMHGQDFVRFVSPSVAGAARVAVQVARHVMR